MTPNDVNEYIAHLFHITDVLYRTSHYIMDRVQDYHSHTYSPVSLEETKLIHYFRNYRSTTQVFDKLLDFRSGDDTTFKFNNRYFR